MPFREGHQMKFGDVKQLSASTDYVNIVHLHTFVNSFLQILCNYFGHGGTPGLTRENTGKDQQES